MLIALFSILIATLHIRPLLGITHAPVLIDGAAPCPTQSQYGAGNPFVMCRAAWVFVPFALITMAALLWSWMLEQQVARRTQELQQELDERCHTERALRESEARFRDVTEAASDWIWEMDDQLQFTYLSERFYALTHIPPQHVLGRTRWGLVPDTATNTEKWVRHREMLEKHLPFRDFTYQAQISEHNNTMRTLKISGKPITDDTGRFLGYRGTGTDITEQVSATAALHATELRLQQIIDLVPHMVFAKDRRGRFLLANRATADAYGSTIDELIHSHAVGSADEISASIWADDREVIESNTSKLVATETFTNYAGQSRTLQTLKIPFLDPRTNEMAALSVAIDISAEKHAKEEAARMRRYLKSVIDSMPSVLIGVDPWGHITVLNQRAEQTCGVAWEAAQGRFFGELFPQLESQFEQVRQTIRLGQPMKTPRMTMDDQNQLHYADVMVYPLTVDGACGAVIRMDDVTARVRIESMMMQSEKMLSIGGLAAGMAHEINNPLGIIVQGCQSVLRRLDPTAPRNQAAAQTVGVDLIAVRDYLAQQKILSFLDNIREAGSRAAKIVTDMLSFSRRSEAQFSRIGVEEMIETVLRLAANDYDLKKRHDFRQITIVRDYDPALRLISCDKTEIEQVLLNLLKNAAQALLEAHYPVPVITLRTRRETQSALIEVIDNGPGIDTEIIGRIFEPFFTTKEVGVGTGLGLSVSYFIVTQQHGGQLSVVSKKGQGTCFSVRLPLVKKAEQPPLSPHRL